MTALERAKRFVQTAAARTALVIVPLAVAAPAAASSLEFYPAAPVAPNVGGELADGTLTVPRQEYTFQDLPDGGVKFYGDYVYNLISGNSGDGYDVTLRLEVNGTASGILDIEEIPAHFHYIFDLGYDLTSGTSSPSHPFTNFSSTIQFKYNGSTAIPFQFGGSNAHASLGPLANGNGTVYEEQSAPDFVLDRWDPSDEVELMNWSALIEAKFFMPGDRTGQVRLLIPMDSIDITPGDAIAPAAVPEPTSLILLGSGTAWLAARRRRASRR